MPVKFRAGLVLSDKSGRALYHCHACREPLRMQRLGYLLQHEEKRRVYRLCLTLWCSVCQRETVLPLESSFADFKQAVEAIRRALESGGYADV